MESLFFLGKVFPQVFFIEKCRKNLPQLWKLSPQDPFLYWGSNRSPRPSGCCFTVVLLLFDLGAGSAAGSLFYGSESIPRGSGFQFVPQVVPLPFLCVRKFRKLSPFHCFVIASRPLGSNCSALVPGSCFPQNE